MKITVEPEHSKEFSIYVRIPGWAQNQPVPSDLYRYLNKSRKKIALKVNDKPFALDIDKGFARIRRNWRKGDVVGLSLPMPIRRVLSHENVKDNAGKTALQRGPIVYCAEWPDNGGRVSNLVLPDDAPLRPEYRKDMLSGVTVICGTARGLYPGEGGELAVTKEQDFIAIPYYAWAHRGKGEMAVWLARNLEGINPLNLPKEETNEEN
ncbi:Non-reducing end beta-L-arabinofuranosidase [subsurface metagenome]